MNPRANPGDPEPVPKLLGSDTELANFIPGRSLPNGTGAVASRRLLREIEGFPGKPEIVAAPADTTAHGYRYSESGENYRHDANETSWRARADGTTEPTFNPQDWGRKFLSNGGCAYIDLNHLEVCTPETLDAREHVAALRAMLEIARCAQETANAARGPRDRITVIANNSDGLGNSYGSHLSVCVDRRVFEDMTTRKLHHLLSLASYQASSIIFTGQGKVGSENGAPRCDYQISQRADFFETLMGHQTTHTRPVVNLRDEALVGWKCKGPNGAPSEADRLARVHIIFYDHALCQVACYLRAGMMQIALAMLERGHADTSLILDDPVASVIAWSHDPDLRLRVPLMGGNRTISAVEWQLRFAEMAARFVASGACDGVVPDAEGIMDLYTDTIEKLHARRFEDLAPRIDWLLKRMLLARALSERNLSWESPQAKHLDQLYGSLDDGLFWRIESNGGAERLVTDAEIERLIHLPPRNTRAWLRGIILRSVPPETIDSVDWDTICLRPTRGSGGPQLIRLNDPFRGEKATRRDAAVADPPEGPQPDCPPADEPTGAAEAPDPASTAAEPRHDAPTTLSDRTKRKQKQRGTKHGNPD